MPKKLGTSSKALEARERRAVKKKEEREQKEKEIEDEYWKDENKHINRKLQRKDEKDEKRQDQLEKKKELKKLYEEELDGVKPVKASKSQPNKLTQAQIASARDNLEAQLNSLTRSKHKEEDVELEPNVNRMVTEGLEARTVEEAISILNVKDGELNDLDRHPERRLKAAYVAYEQSMLPVLREENPGLRNSQLKQLVFKKFQTAPENPKIQPHGSYNQS